MGSAKLHNGSASYGGITSASGAFVAGSSFGGNTFYDALGSWNKSLMTFNASKSSGIYGKSSTVQPNSVRVYYCIKY